MNPASLADPAIPAAADVATLRVGLVGYGEVATIFGRALARAGVASVTAFDVKIADVAWASPARERAARIALVGPARAAVGTLCRSVLVKGMEALAIESLLEHGRRRAEEVREAAGAERDAGVAARMASATAETQAWIAALTAAGAFAAADDASDWRSLPDCIEHADGSR
ncbi:MAG TPA: DUF1932 domain-containing protein [Casimicrobiaceae bacterium]|nr:DUF1932 domain-containing protein [Casimicrobiaceae bacterium]